MSTAGTDNCLFDSKRQQEEGKDGNDLNKVSKNGLLPSFQLVVTNMLTGHYSECTKKLLQNQPSEAVVVDERAFVTVDLHLTNMFLI